MKIELIVNDRRHSVEIEPGEMLIETLRKLDYKSVKHSCSTASCGSCTVQLDGKAVLSCMTFSASADGHAVKTVDAFSKNGKLSRIQKALLEEGGSQCGFCIPGLVVTAEALLDENPEPTEEEVKNYMNGNLCRCTGYESQTRAVLKASKMRGDNAENN